jgi:ribosomal protein S18 acetylase RimI-like enzyme
MIRRWTLDDLPAVQRVLRETWRDAYGSFIPEVDLDAYFHEHYNLEALRQLFGTEGVDGLVAQVDDEVVGIARTAFNAEEMRFTVASLYVLPTYQGKGIGSELLAHAERLALACGADVIWLGVMEQNTPALQWYQRIGFTFVEMAPFVMGSTTVLHRIGYRQLQRGITPRMDHKER